METHPGHFCLISCGRGSWQKPSSLRLPYFSSSGALYCRRRGLNDSAPDPDHARIARSSSATLSLMRLFRSTMV